MLLHEEARDVGADGSRTQIRDDDVDERQIDHAAVDAGVVGRVLDRLDLIDGRHVRRQVHAQVAAAAFDGHVAFVAPIEKSRGAEVVSSSHADRANVLEITNTAANRVCRIKGGCT